MPLNKETKPNHTYVMCMHKQDLTLNNVQWLIRHKTQPTNQPTNQLFNHYTTGVTPSYLSLQKLWIKKVSANRFWDISLFLVIVSPARLLEYVFCKRRPSHIRPDMKLWYNLPPYFFYVNGSSVKLWFAAEIA